MVIVVVSFQSCMHDLLSHAVFVLKIFMTGLCNFSLMIVLTDRLNKSQVWRYNPILLVDIDFAG